MMIVGVTGGIGSGKSTVCKVFSTLGIPVYDSDSEAKLMYDRYPELKEKVKNLFGDDVLDKNGNINKKKLAEIIFKDEVKLQSLNQLIHPLVKWDFTNWVETHQGFPYLIKEAAILFESGANLKCNKIITVTSPSELKFERIKIRDKKSTLEIENIVKSQMSDEEKVSKSDFVIYNDEKQLVIPQVLKIHEALLK